MTEESPPGPRVIEAFQGYSPSFHVDCLIHEMLREVPSRLLWGLHSVVLTNAAALSRKERKRKGLGHPRMALEKALAYYSQAWMGEPARIVILLDNIENQWSGLWWRFEFIRSWALSEIFLHEMGHHIHRVHRPEFADKENVAEEWSLKLSGRFLRNRYWYLKAVLTPVALIVGLGQEMTKLLRRIWRKGKVK